jgi:transglutaminase-like putative cysteine protease
MKTNILLLLIILSIGKTKADGYPVSTIPENLKTNAFAVVRENSHSFKQQDLRNGSCLITYVIAVLDAKGSDYANFLISEDSYMELKSFSGEVFNAAGKTIRKIGKKDLTTTAYSEHLSTDTKRTFYEYHAPAYPFTIKYEYEIKFKNGILIYPTFYPLAGFHLSLEHADYSIQIPPDVELRYKLNAVPEPEKSVVKENTVYNWSMKNIEALPYERFAPTNELFPYALLSPAKFCIEDACGDMSNWESFGKWQNELLTGKTQLSQKTIDKVLELTRDIPGKREKVKRIYEYMQSTTHYVSIQLGIGGWQPMKAEEVGRTSFGDCKALSNYMRAMLSAIDIPSYYTIISMRRERFFKDYPNFSQADHVILMVPLEKDSLWLECTTQTLPFGYIHSSIAGHDALAVGDDKSFFCTLPSYPPADGKEINHVDIRLGADGAAEMNVHSTYSLSEYETMHYKLKGLSYNEEIDALGRLLQVPKPQVSNVRKEENRSEQPRMDVFYTVNCEDYASQTGSRMFVSVNPARTGLKGFLTGSSRHFDIVLKSGIYQSDTISIRIPDGFSLESKPKPTEIVSEFGFFRTNFIEEGNLLKYIQTMEIKANRYLAVQFEDMKKFFSQIENLQTGKIGFKK